MLLLPFPYNEEQNDIKRICSFNRFHNNICGISVRDYSFISLTQSLLRNKSRQVLGKGREICLEDTDGQVLAKGCEIL